MHPSHCIAHFLSKNVERYFSRKTRFVVVLCSRQYALSEKAMGLANDYHHFSNTNLYQTARG